MKRYGYLIAFLSFIAIIAVVSHRCAVPKTIPQNQSEQLISKTFPNDPYQSLKCQSPILVQFFRELDSVDLVLEDKIDLDWVSTVLDGVEIVYNKDVEAVFGTNDWAYTPQAHSVRGGLGVFFFLLIENYILALFSILCYN